MLQVIPLNSEDYDLITAAEKVIEKNYKYGRHHIGSAVRTTTGNIYAAVHVEANVGRITVCGEAMAIGKSISEGDHEFDTIVAVAHPHPHEDIEKCWVVAPCGMCRELISDYGKNTNVILSYNGELVKCNVMELLPEKYTSEVE
ncbi:cytidine deaminase [Bacillus mobilis]|uniref:Cytidine deaminase n=2 Tax=Bacillus cereus group TaxID=86661 RepID=A0A1C4CXG8_BACCE|nr:MULTISPECIES: cytidine deaminase [Bacillus cereus group]MCU5436903.1 cytidine deaminase [Bacillus mobilis]MCU5593470.1 cytidine deaminase [Bacillus mobilis]MCU5739561.1 cytidine deaminase [Bacillus mobilis]MCU9561564.1 cytidine deaminase [Bacillus mobilis]OKA37840.1 cytidine deaminase [Bacillus cereus]